MITAIIACEIGFWVLLIGGLLVRYVLRLPRLGAALLIAVPLVDVALLAISVVDLRRGGTGSAVHGLAAIYLGCSIAFGHSMVRWADQRVAHRFVGGPPPVGKPRFGLERAAYERRAWLTHLLAYVIAAVVLGVFTLLVGDVDRALPLWQPMRVWGLVLLIDLVVSLSYTVAPRREPEDFRAANRTAPRLHSNTTGNTRSD